MEINKIYQEPCLETVSRMPDNFLDCVITSPPYWQLRDYGYEGQWGLEPTYQQYLEHLWSLMDAIYPKLKDGGTVWVNLGDTYARGSRSKDGTNHTVINKSKEHHIEPLTKPDYGSLDKCLLLIPHRFAIGCIDRNWIMRNDVIWAKRNGMPESVTDRFSKKHEYFFFMVKSEKYYFDLDAIRDKQITGNDRCDTLKTATSGSLTSNNSGRIEELKANGFVQMKNNPNGKNPGSVSDFWDILTRPSSEKHYASYNDSLLVKPILAGCPKDGIIYDPFMGTGSTAEAAIRAGRNFIGSEMSTDYCQIAERRLQPFLMQTTLF